jgi:hypothetical protein
VIVKITRDRWNEDTYRVVVYDGGIDVTLIYTKAIIIDAKDYDDFNLEEYIVEAKNVKVDKDNVVMIETLTNTNINIDICKDR